MAEVLEDQFAITSLESEPSSAVSVAVSSSTSKPISNSNSTPVTRRRYKTTSPRISTRTPPSRKTKTNPLSNLEPPKLSSHLFSSNSSSSSSSSSNLFGISQSISCEDMFGINGSLTVLKANGCFEMNDITDSLNDVDIEMGVEGSGEETETNKGHERKVLKLMTASDLVVKRKFESIDDTSKIGVNLKVVSIKDLPEELMLKIFSHLPDRFGFSSSVNSTGAKGIGREWNTPPLKIGLVCKYWLNICRQVFYRNLSVSHIKRLSLVHRVLQVSNLASHVRRIAIRLPYNVSELLDTPIPALPSLTKPAIDSNLRPEKKDKRTDFVKKYIKPLSIDHPHNIGFISVKIEEITPREMLRDVLKLCPNLLCLEIVGIELSTLLSPPPLPLNTLTSTTSTYASALLRKLPSSNPFLVAAPPQPFHRLLQLRLDSISTLSLSATIDGSELNSKELSSTLLLLSNLLVLKIVRYASSNSSPLSFNSSTITSIGNEAKSLPSRARRISLRTLQITESTFNEADLKALLEYIKPGSLKNLSIDQVYEPRRRSDSRMKVLGEDLPTVCSIPAVYHLLHSLITLRISLYNYSITSTQFDTSNLIDLLLPHLTQLENLKIGGRVCTKEVLNILPSTVKKLTLVSCSELNPKIVEDFLKDLAKSRNSIGFNSEGNPKLTTLQEIDMNLPGESRGVASLPNSPNRKQRISESRLARLEILGGGDSGWKTAGEDNWKVQRACWEAGVVWRKW